MAFSLQTEKAVGVIVLVLNGYVDKAAAQQIKAVVGTHIGSRAHRFVLDFTLAPMVNSSGLAELIDLFSQCISDVNLRFVVCGLSQIARFSFTTVGIFHFANEAENRVKAIASAGAASSA